RRRPELEAVDETRVGGAARVQRGAQTREVRPVQPVAVDDVRREDVDGDARGAADHRAVQLVARLRIDLLRVVEERERPDAVVTQPAVVQQHAGNNERACERPAAGLVRAGDQAHAEPPVERQQLRSRSLRGHAASIAPAPARSRGSAAKSTKSLRRAELADAGLLADLAAEVVELGAIDVADRADLDLVDLRRVQRERPLDADAEVVLADGEGLAGAGALPLDHEALEDLDPL